MKLAVLILMTLLAFCAVSSLAGSHDPILQRQELMEGMKDNALRPMVGMAREQVEFDAAQVADGIDIMRNVAQEAPGLFPEGSDTGHDTEALPAIWEDPEGFEEALSNFGAAVDRAHQAPPQSLDELRAMLNDVLKTCKGCHDTYRVEQEGANG